MRTRHLPVLALVVAVLIGLPSTAVAQVGCGSGLPVTVANGDSTTTTQFFPGHGYYKYSYTEVIVPAEKLEGIGDIQALEFLPLASNTNSSVYTDCDVYLAHTDRTDLTAGFIQDVGSFELVFSGSLNFTAGQWKRVVFDTPFAYNGVSNLVVAVKRNTGSYGSSGKTFAACTASANLGRYVQVDGSTPYTLGSVSGGSAVGTVPVYRFVGCPPAPVSCARVVELAASNVTSNGATLTWNDTALTNASATYSIYNGEVLLASGISATSYTLTTLNPNTDYRLSVVANCSEGDQSLPRSVAFHTLCGLEATPYGEDFNLLTAGTVPPCWTHFGSGTALVNNNSSNAHSGLYLHFQGSLNNLIATPPTAAPLSTLQAHFWLRPENPSNSNCGHFSVGYVTDLSDSTSFVAVETFSYNNFSAGYMELEVPMTGAPAGAVAAFRANPALTNFYWYLDDVVLEPVPTCIKVSNLTASNPTPQGITLGWSDEANASATYSIYNGDELLASGIAATTYTLTTLEPNTPYTLSVAANCADDDESARRDVSFRTACTPTQSLPYAEGFEGYGNLEFPSCWSRYGYYVSNPQYIYPYVSTSSAHTGSNRLYMYYQHNATQPNKPQYAVSPLLDAPANQLHITFWASFSSQYMDDEMQVGVMTGEDTDSFVPLLTVRAIDATRNVYAPYEIYTDDVASTDNARVAFRWSSTNNSNLSIDDLLVELASDCRKPINLSVSNISYEQATLGWEDSGDPAHTHLVRYATENDPTAATAETVSVASGSSLTLDGLASGTTYYAWVATQCGSETTEWAPFGSFTTELDCYPVVGAAIGHVTLTSAALTWAYDTQHGREASEVAITLYDMADPANPTTLTATGTLAFLTGLEPSHTYLATLTTSCQGYASTPASVSFSTLDCGKAAGGGSWQFGMFNGNYGYGYSQTLYPASLVESIDTITGISVSLYSRATSVPNRTVDIYLANTDLTNLDTNLYLDPSELTLVAEDVTLNVNSAGWKTLQFDTPFANQHGQNIVVAMVNKTGQYQTFMWNCHEADFGVMVCWNTDAAPINLANPMAATTAPSRGRHSKVADISFLGTCDLSGCRAPLAAAASVGTDSVALAWAPGNSETSWVVEYRRTTDTAWMVATATSLTSCTIGGLLPATGYQFRVGGLCDGGDTLYSSVVALHTQCAEMTFPYLEGFEEWSAAVFPACWSRPAVFTSSNVTYPIVAENAGMAHSGSRYIDFYGSGSNPNLLVSSEVPLTANQIHVEFWARLGAYNNAHILQAGLMTDPTDLSTFVPVKTLQGTLSNYEWQMHEFYTDSVELDVNPVYVAFLYRTTGSTNFHCFLDDVVINQSSACRRPEEGSVVSHTYEEATLRWQQAPTQPDGYTVRLTHSFSTEDDNLVEQTFGDTIATLTGLDFGTEYHAWVASNCGAEQSDWFYLGAFTTDERCAPVQSITVVSTEHNTASLLWEYDGLHGIEATGVNIAALDIDHPGADTLTYYFGTTGGVLTDLAPGTTYRVWVQTECSSDLARTSPSVVLTTRTCAMAEGDGSLYTWQIPVREYSTRHSYCQSLYPDTLLHGMDTLRGVAFKVHSGAAGHDHPLTVDIYVGSTARTSLSQSSYVPTTSMVKVAEGYTLDVTRTGWFVIPFDTVFAPVADSNIVVTVVNNTGTSYQQYLYWSYHNATSNSTLTYYNTTTDVLDPDNLAGSRTTFNYVPDIMFLGECNYDCHAPTMTVDGATTESITVSWVAGESEQSWLVGYRGADGVWHDELTDANPYTIADLAPSSSYEVRVGSFCLDEDGEASDTLFATLSTYTLCAPTPVPYTAPLNSALGPCWTVSHPASVYAETSSQSLYMASPGYFAVLPEVDQELADVQLKLGFSLTNTSYSLMVGATDDNGANITWIDTLRVATAHQPVETVTHFLSYTGTGRRIVVANGSGTYYTRISSVVVEPLESCFPVDSLRAFADVGSVSLSWTYGEEVEQYEVQYRSTETSTWSSQLVDSPSALVTGLAHSTAYTFRVRALCGDENAARWTSITLTTPCDAATMPLVEDFEGLNSNQMLTQVLSCWNFYETPYEQVMNGSPLRPMTSYRWSGAPGPIDGHGLRIEIYGDTNNVRHWAVTPAVDVDDDQVLLAFDYAVVNVYNTPDADDRFILAATTDGGRTWQPMAMWGSDPQRDTFQLTGLYSAPIHVELPLAAFVGDTVRFAFYGQSGAPGGDFYLYLDNLRIGRAACPPPTVVVAETTGHSIAVAIGADQPCEVHITPGEWSDAVSGTTVSESAYTFDGLTPGLTYTLGVRQRCGDDDYSEWVTRTVTTEAPDCQAPMLNPVADITATSATATWSGDEGVQQWQARLWADGGQPLDLAATSPTLALGDLQPATTYHLAVRSVCGDQFFSPWSDTLSFLTPDLPAQPCPAPTAISVTLVDETTASIDWVSDAPQWKLRLNGDERTVSTKPYTVSGLAPQATYTVSVQALCEDGTQSPWSDEALFTGIDSLRGEAVSLYPNPTSGAVTLLGLERGAQVELVDLNGRHLGHWSSPDGNLSLDVSPLARGTYFVRITGQAGTAIRKLIVR